MSNIINFGGGATLTPFKPEGKSYLTFSSPNSFTLAVGDATKHWDGTLEYFASNKTWTTWDGTTTLSSVENDGEHVLYLRGTGNTVITGDNQNYRWVLTGSDISCIGNIENLLDYETVVSGNHPTMANYCYANMFRDCTSLIQVPELPATTLASQCYSYMFQGCTSLIQAPALPATTLTYNCYANMFRDCTSLTQAPALPATTLASQCYSWMFQGCTSLTKAPELPATTLANYCYYDMFRDCTSLTQSPALQATTLADYCYEYMFAGCLALTQVPALPATTLAFRCYYNMFRGCTSLKLSSTKIGEYTQEYCIPSSGTGTTSTDALSNMFTSTGGTFTGAPSINTTYYLSTDNMIVRETEVATLNGYVGSMIDVKAEGKQAKITASGLLKGNGSGGVSAAVKGTDYAGPSVGVTVTLTAAGWDANAKTQTVSVAGVTATANGSLRIAQSATDEQFAAWGAAQPRVTAQADGSITVKLAGTVPTMDIPVEVLIV